MSGDLRPGSIVEFFYHRAQALVESRLTGGDECADRRQAGRAGGRYLRRCDSSIPPIARTGIVTRRHTSASTSAPAAA